MDQSPVTLSIKGSAEQVAIAWAGMLRAFAEESSPNADGALAPVRMLHSVREVEEVSLRTS